MNIENNLNKLILGEAKLVLKKIPENTIDLVITSPPYWHAVEYDKQTANQSYEEYLNDLVLIFKECFRVLRPNGKLAINTPVMPIPQEIIKQDVRHLKDISSDLSNKLLNETKFNLFSVFVWQKQTSKLMFGSYPYPGNLLENNTIEFIKVYVKPGKSKKYLKFIKSNNKIKRLEWLDLTQQVWFMTPEDISRKNNHPAPFPEKLPARLIKLYTMGAINSFNGDIVLDPFVGTGTTCVAAKKMKRQFIGIDQSPTYIEFANGRLFKTKYGENINYLVGKTKYETKDQLNSIWKELSLLREKKISEEKIEKAIKKHRSKNYGRDAKKIVQPTLFEK